MESDTIAIESLTWWGGLKTNQSKIAFQWLHYQDKHLGGNRIRHSRNGKSNGKAMEKSKWMVMTLRPKQCTSSTVVNFTDARNVNWIIDTSNEGVIRSTWHYNDNNKSTSPLERKEFFFYRKKVFLKEEIHSWLVSTVTWMRQKI